MSEKSNESDDPGHGVDQAHCGPVADTIRVPKVPANLKVDVCLRTVAAMGEKAQGNGDKLPPNSALSAIYYSALTDARVSQSALVAAAQGTTQEKDRAASTLAHLDALLARLEEKGRDNLSGWEDCLLKTRQALRRSVRGGRLAGHF